MALKYTKLPQNISNEHKIYQHFPLQDPPKYTQNAIFGIKSKPSGKPAAVVFLVAFLATILLANFAARKQGDQMSML
jgi:hypothetical protein